MKIALDPRLEQSSTFICDTDVSQIRLSNNALVPWFLIIPKTSKTEWFELAPELQFSLNAQINQLSALLKHELDADKINIATIGNVVPQLHIHVIGRKVDDFCWPDVVWGVKVSRDYAPDIKDKIKQLARVALNKLQ
ncbi:HIT family protein [Facilibium subflavum]|uniref:HIT family protein n=1 Tax=Facilibium subflavum TaxID=2219058 RepID=UPI0013C2BEC2|nr:HIT family protein [Facilibium subflavum]